MMSSSREDTEYWANVAAEELGQAMTKMGLGFLGTVGDEDGNVTVAFPSLRDVEALMVLAVPADHTPGSLYDRASASCVTLSSYAADGVEPTPDVIAQAVDAGWMWAIHPHMVARRMDWHVSVDLPTSDANQVTANLNALRLGGGI